MDKVLTFKAFAQNNRKYYIADLELAKKGYTYAHQHDFYEFFVILQGEFEQIINGRHLILGEGQMHILKPEDSHYFVATDRYEKNILRNIAVEKKHFESCLEQVGSENMEAVFSVFKLDEVTAMSYKVKTNLLLQSTNNEITNHFVFENILGELFIVGLLQKNKQNNIPKWLQKAYFELEQDKNYIVGLDRFISLTGKSQEHVTRAFKKYYGITPSEYINSLRLQEAAMLLRTCDKKIIEIIYESGFNNISYFNRLFKSRYGLSPRDYRSTNKKMF